MRSQTAVETSENAGRGVRVLFASLLLLGSLATSGCSSAKKELVGQWHETGKTEQIEFFEDGRATVADEGMTFTGTWTSLGGSQVKLEFETPSGARVVTGKVEGRVMTLATGSNISRYDKVGR